MDSHQNNNEDQRSSTSLYVLLGITLAAGLLVAAKFIFY